MRKLKSFIITNLIRLVIIIAFLGLFFGPRIMDGFTSVKVLTDSCLEESKHKYRVGAICRDGWRSSATGRGACSNHSGVKRWLYKEKYTKTKNECVEYAKERFWIE